MSNKRPEEGFRHDPNPVAGAEARLRREGATDDVTISFGDGSEDLKMDRREFMRVSGVAAATAAMAGSACRSPVEKIVPYVDRPEEIRIGTPNYYATFCSGCSANCGALAQTRGGRPIKLEGNPRHPVSQGALCARGQAWYLDLYDPSRARMPARLGDSPTEMKWEEVDAEVKAALAKAKGVALLTRTINGPARVALIEEIGRALPGFKHYQYEAIGSEAALGTTEAGFGARHVPLYHFDRADVVVSLGADFLGTWLSPVQFTKDWSKRRDPNGRMSRVVVFEGHMTVTGMSADDRYRARPSDLPYIAMALANVVLAQKKAGPLARSAAAGAVGAFTPEAVSELTGIPADVFTRIGGELAEHAGASIVVAGGTSAHQAGGVSLESAVNLLNTALQNDGRTIDRSRPSLQSLGSHTQLAQLVADINSGKIDTLIVDGCNPIYSAAPDLEVAKAFEKLAFMVSVSDRADETAQYAKILAPQGHPLEAWGDSQPIAGTYAIQQPTITPLFETRSLENSLIAWVGEKVPSVAKHAAIPEAPAGNRPGANNAPDPGAWYRYLRNHWETKLFAQAKTLGSAREFWEDSLRTGVFQSSATGTKLAARLPAILGSLPKEMPPKRAENKPNDLSTKEIELVATVPLYDGSQANNGHLQELPDPITKHVWGTFIALSPSTFEAAGLEHGQWVEVTPEGGTAMRFQALMQPGLHDDVIAMPLGYGRTAAGITANEVGENTYLLTRSADGARAFAGLTASIKKLGDTDKIAIVQGAQILDTKRRPIASTTTLEEYKANPSAGIHTHAPGPDMWDSHDYGELKWGMSIDLTKCTGCSACVTACMEENNIPVVGRQGILEGREMHWIRVDRYYQLPNTKEVYELQSSVFNDPMFEKVPMEGFSKFMDNPVVINQPMMCQHCEHAPCETVCPVSATMHSADGLNQMAYNRCVGTRYCSNNCPFKVRRFNWYNYVTDRREGWSAFLTKLYPELGRHADLNVREPLQMGNNPDVTVRARGVMEKCTFCIQRIRRAKVQLRKEGRSRIQDGDVIPACQQTCPADAIVFGNLSDEESAVAKLHAEKRALSPLVEVGVHSSVAYLTSVRNSHEKPAGNEAAADAHAADHG